MRSVRVECLWLVRARLAFHTLHCMDSVNRVLVAAQQAADS
jgi:hypothetical protein